VEQEPVMDKVRKWLAGNEEDDVIGSISSSDNNGRYNWNLK
jgi:hypothetical protein